MRFFSKGCATAKAKAARSPPEKNSSALWLWGIAIWPRSRACGRIGL